MSDTMSDLGEMAAVRIAWETADAYSADIWGPVRWTECASMLLQMGFTDAQARAVLRSKITRWARDAYGHPDTWIGQVAVLAEDRRAQIAAGEYGSGEIGQHAKTTK